MQIQPYLSFDGRCEEAVAFYGRTLGAKVEMMMRWKDAPPGACPEGMSTPPADKIMHAALRIGDSMMLASDGSCQGQPKFQGISLSLTPKDPAEAERVFNALADGGQVQMPLGKTFFSPAFGMVADRFGVSWMVYVAQ
ncbi:MAG TPA: VOC family protein [Stellaceae bacterium]|jgi:PhnB protein|nr:VOC family protein [Stellaceae bacterium]